MKAKLLAGGLTIGVVLLFSGIALAGASGNNEAKIINERLRVTTAHPGETIVLQQFSIVDPGPSVSTNDHLPTLVQSVSVKFVDPDTTVQTPAVKRLRLFRESPRTSQGWQEGDDLLGEILNPDLEKGAEFSRGGKILSRVWLEQRFYIVADLAPAGFAYGDTNIMKIQVTVLAGDDLRHNQKSSGIINPTVMAEDQVKIEVSAPTITIGSIELSSPGKVVISVSDIPEEGLEELDGILTFDATVFQIKKLRGLSGYIVQTPPLDAFDLLEEILEEANGEGKLQLNLQTGETRINNGPILELIIERAEDAELCMETQVNLVVKTLSYKPRKDNIKPIKAPKVEAGTVRINLLGGDVDLNGVVTRRDARLAAKLIRQPFDPMDPAHRAADVAEPFGQINVPDVRLIKKAAAKKITLPSACDNPVHSEALSYQGNEASFGKLRVEGIFAYPNPLMRAEAVEFMVQGVGIAAIQVQIFNLAGAKVFEEQALGNHLRFYVDKSEAGSGQRLANGVYLYIINVRGLNGELVRSEVRKLVILR